MALSSCGRHDYAVVYDSIIESKNFEYPACELEKDMKDLEAAIKNFNSIIEGKKQ
jgi:hypothetical protein